MLVSVRSTRLERNAGHWVGRFEAMASPCEVLVETQDRLAARAVVDAVAACTWRIEDKYSRYRDNNIVHSINQSGGRPIEVDDETAGLLDFADALYRLSNGLFDITSGVLRRAWSFDGGHQVPDANRIRELLGLVGWHKTSWQRPFFTLQPGMQIDLGGFGKEYAVDQAAAIASEMLAGSCLINLGGDLAVTRARQDGSAWQVGIEAADAHAQKAARHIELHTGALATSGDTHRFVLRDGRRYTHILDPRTGWPIEHAPRSVTVAADSCTQAGMLTTLAILQGAEAGEFLLTEGVRHWIQW